MIHFWNSIIFKITLLFLAALLGFSTCSLFFIKHRLEEDQAISSARYNQIANMINEIRRFGGDMEMVQYYLNEMGFAIIESSLISTLDLHHNFFDEDFEHGSVHIKSYKGSIYILLQDGRESILYGEKIARSNSTLYLIAFVGIGILTFIYVLLMRSLLPLNSLRRQIANMDSTHTDYIPLLEHPESEIELLTNEFYRFSNKIRSINESRLLFLRSIMHELKTPITKGRIVAEMLDDQTQKERLCSVFSRLNELITEFAKIEQLTSQMYNIKKSEFLLEDLINFTREMLLVEKSDDPITLDSPYALIKADFEIFAITIKNMIDNAIKYGEDGKVRVYVHKEALCIANKGAQLKLDLSEYFKPYFRDSKKNVQGFGLGMYIIKNTLDSQNFTLKYAHENGDNIFMIKGCVVDNFCKLENRPKFVEIRKD